MYGSVHYTKDDISNYFNKDLHHNALVLTLIYMDRT